jgi:hypothetical protein
MRSTYQEAQASGKPSIWRLTLSVVSILVALAITAALVTQIFDQVVRGTFIPSRYFAYFSIQTSIVNIVVLLVTGIAGLQTVKDSRGLAATRGSIVTYAVITGVVYNVLLRDLVESPPSGEILVQWPIELTHVWVPIYLVADWILSPHRAKLSWSFLLIGLVYPALWFLLTEIRGSITGWYPYEFLNPSGSEDGLIRVLTYTGIIGIFGLLCLSMVFLVNRIHHSLSTRHVASQ